MSSKQKNLARIELEQLVLNFKTHIAAYKLPSYNEATLRIDFLNKFFELLGWDVANKKGVSPSYREVVTEDSVEVEGRSKSPDYSFKSANGKRLFFVEAKKPFVNISRHQDSSFQLRRYGWSAHLPVSILTSFEYLIVYDCTSKPKEDDPASHARVKILHFEEYVEKFDYLWDNFSYESFQSRDLEAYFNGDRRGKKGDESVDSDFLASLDVWRGELAKDINKHNSLDEDDLNFAVQQIIDRIIFLRIAEDRDVENYGELKKVLEGENFYSELNILSSKADDKYNSGLFKNSELLRSVKVSNSVLKNIVEGLYFPISPYEFSVVPIEILGKAYEQFLGKQITIDSAGKVKIEDKPHVKKSGGVFYTPSYIVEGIVHSTVAKLCEGKNLKQVSDLKILDPACGSGSFLIAAYEYLLGWHRDYFNKNKKKLAKKVLNDCITPNGDLTSRFKGQILLNNIYGVDIDRNAVEVTKLSLLLKCLEGETKDTVKAQMNLFHERLLPTLDDNIRCGNSLIDFDIYSKYPDLDSDIRIKRRINSFNWRIAFPKFYKATGSFDVVLGNPPWVSLSGKFGNEILTEQAQSYLISKYSGNTYMPNLYEYFVDKGISLTKKKGFFSFVVPDRLGFNSQFVNLRKKILKSVRIQELIYKTPFPGIVTDTLIFRFKKEKPASKIIVSEYGKTPIQKSISTYLKDPEFKFSYQQNENIELVLKKIFSNRSCKALGEIADTTSGFGGKSELLSEQRLSDQQIPVLRGRNVFRYEVVGNFYFDFISQNITGRTTDKSKLSAVPKVLLRKTGLPLLATYDESGVFPEQSLYFIFNASNVSLKYVAGFLNSRLFQFIYSHKLVTNKNSTPQLKKMDLDKTPIKIPSKKLEIDAVNQICSYVDKLLSLHALRSTLSERKKEESQAEIKFYEDLIDKEIYKFYGLSDTEVRVVEGAL